nr:hypothetical protein [Tanacetum cinerariifolium]
GKDSITWQSMVWMEEDVKDGLDKQGNDSLRIYESGCLLLCFEIFLIKCSILVSADGGPISPGDPKYIGGRLSYGATLSTSDEKFKLSRHGGDYGLELKQKKEKQTNVIGMCFIIPKPRRR